MDGMCTEAKQDTGGGGAEQPSSSSHAHPPDETLHDDHETLPIDQHLRADDRFERAATRKSGLEAGTDEPIEADDNDVDAHQRSHVLRARIHTAATLSESSESRGSFGLRLLSAKSELELDQTGGIDGGLVDSVEESADRSGAGTSTVSDTQSLQAAGNSPWMNFAIFKDFLMRAAKQLAFRENCKLWRKWQGKWESRFHLSSQRQWQPQPPLRLPPHLRCTPALRRARRRRHLLVRKLLRFHCRSQAGAPELKTCRQKLIINSFRVTVTMNRARTPRSC